MTISESEVLVRPVQDVRRAVSSEGPAIEETITSINGDIHVSTDGDSKANTYILILL